MNPFNPPPPPPAVQPTSKPTMPALAFWSYILSFLCSPLSLILCVMTIRKYPDHARAKGLAYVSIVIGLFYLAVFTLVRFKT